MGDHDTVLVVQKLEGALVAPLVALVQAVAIRIASRLTYMGLSVLTNLSTFIARPVFLTRTLE